MVKTRWLLLLLVLSLVPVWVAGCAPETKYRLLSTFFDGVPEPGKEPPKKRTVSLRRMSQKRRMLELKKKKAEKVEAKVEKLEAEKFRSYSQVANVLPKSYAGAIDWVKALKEAKIKPRPGLDPQAVDQPSLSLDIELASSGNPMFAARFPHSSHTLWLACTNCHTKIFQMKRGEARITMADIIQGKYCGRCHGPNPVAFSATSACSRCHRKLAKEEAPAQAKPAPTPIPFEKIKTWDQLVKQMPKDAVGGVDWVKALAQDKISPQPALLAGALDQPVLKLDIELVPKVNPAFKVIFSHAVHTQRLTCSNCHPSIFKMKKGTAKMGMAQIMAGQYCGRCHGKVAFQVQTGCARCHAVMRGG